MTLAPGSPEDLTEPTAAPESAADPADSRPEALPLLGAGMIRELAAEYGVRPTKTKGQNFVHDANTVRRIVRAADLEGVTRVLEVGPGLGSLTLALLEVVPEVVAVEIDEVLAEALPRTMQRVAPERAGDLTVLLGDALRVTELPEPHPQALVANLPYNVAVPVVLTLLERFSSLRSVLVMVQLEVAERLAAKPGTSAYGAPSAKAAWYCDVKFAGKVPRAIFWPVPGVDSALVSMVRHEGLATEASREETFAVIDAAFAQRRKTLRAALSGWAGSADAAEAALRTAGVDPKQRGEQLDVRAFAAIAASKSVAIS